jgi:hypothetical protein
MNGELVKRFWAKVDRGNPSECWEWIAYRDRHGYGRFNIDRIPELAHRVSYRLLQGEIPNGMTLDHLCRNRACVNPAHLEPVSRGENVLRGMSGPAQNARKTHCKYGHAFTPENTYRMADGRRVCIACRRRNSREKSRERRRRLQEAA